MNNINGIIIFNKPEGITSHDVVYILRKKLNIKKIGHTGTLDPMATGVLPMCIGKATKISEYFLKSDKEYIAEFEFGYETKTLDRTSEVIERNTNIPTKENLKSILKEFKGKISQVPPKYSALKVNGKKLYELAREGIEVDIKPRTIEIYELEILKQINEKTFEIRVKCSSGTYIRSLIRDIARKLNSLATLTNLKRIKTGNFMIDSSITKDELDKLSVEDIKNKIIKIDDALNNMGTYEIPRNFYERLINGVKFRKILNFNNGELIKIYCKDEFIGIGEYISSDNFMGIKMKKMLR